jgi:hypothetical protein
MSQLREDMGRLLEAREYSVTAAQSRALRRWTLTHGAMVAKTELDPTGVWRVKVLVPKGDKIKTTHLQVGRGGKIRL